MVPVPQVAPDTHPRRSAGQECDSRET